MKKPRIYGKEARRIADIEREVLDAVAQWVAFIQWFDELRVIDDRNDPRFKEQLAAMRQMGIVEKNALKKASKLIHSGKKRAKAIKEAWELT